MTPQLLIHRTRAGVQLYELVAIEPYVRCDGRQSRYAVWSSACRICRRKFYITTSAASERAIARRAAAKGMTVHCPDHRLRTSPAAARRNAELAARYGRP